MAKKNKGWTKERRARFQATVARKREARAVGTRMREGQSPATIAPLGPPAFDPQRLFRGFEHTLTQHTIEDVAVRQEVPKSSVRMDFGDFTVTVDWKEK